MLVATATSGAKRFDSRNQFFFCSGVIEPVTLNRARTLRANQTESEARLWGELRGRKLQGWKWRRQAPIGPFIVDFFCPAARLVVEIDGGQHLDQVEYDARRTRFLEQRGLRVIRFESDQIWGGGLTFVLQTIAEACQSTTYE